MIAMAPATRVTFRREGFTLFFPWPVKTTLRPAWYASDPNLHVVLYSPNTTDRWDPRRRLAPGVTLERRARILLQGM